MKRVVCLLLGVIFVILASCAGPGTREKPGEVYVFDDGITEPETGETVQPATPEEHSFEQNFDEKLKTNDKVWSINSEGIFKDGFLCSKTNHTFLALKEKVKADTLTVELDLKAARKGLADNVSGYIGLRQPMHNDQFAAVGPNGIWIAFHCNRVGIITTWPSVKVFKCDVDFSELRHVIITDDTVNNVITVDVADGTEKKTVMTIKIEDGKQVTLFDANGKSKSKTNFGHEIDDSGYIAFWACGGNSGECVMDNIKINWKDRIPESYVPADLTLLRDLYPDTWTAVDELGRSVNYGTSVPRDKLVGIFYQIWFTPTNVTYGDQKIYDHYKIYREKGLEGVKKAYTQGPEGWGHFWGEPYFGYYLTNDRWIIRKHASMLADIGIDFIFLDVTNGNPLTTSYKAIFKEYAQMRKEGLKTPDICFFLGAHENVENVFLDIWENIYSTGKYSDLYVIYDGKPLMLGTFDSVSEETKALTANFTTRRCWALKENVEEGKNFWTWMCESPQVSSYNTAKNNEVEEISISAGILANTSSGRSFHDGKQPKIGKLADGSRDEFQFNLATTGQGLFFAEQMKYAAEVDPYVVLITEWNEWIAGRWEGTTNPMIANTYVSWSQSFYVDCFNPEFSRDIEPMRDGFGDNYYYQLASFIREFKGARQAPAASGQHDIDPAGGLEQWADVRPEYCDTSGDTIHRDSLGYGGLVKYKNETGRNDFVTTKVSRANGKTYFLAVCKDNITAPEGANWMNLFVDTDCNASNGWYGYDLIVKPGDRSVEKFKDGWNTEIICGAEVYTEGNYIVVTLNDSECGLAKEFNFKWADNSTENGTVMEFLDLGDAAPNARFNHAYRVETGEVKLGEKVRKVVADGASFTANRPYALSGMKSVPVYEPDTSVVPVMYKGRVFVPASSLNVVKNMTVEIKDGGATVTYKDKAFTFSDGSTRVPCNNFSYTVPVAPFTKNGQLFVPLNAVAHIAKLNYAQNDLGVAIITPADIKDKASVEKILSDLYVSY